MKELGYWFHLFSGALIGWENHVGQTEVETRGKINSQWLTREIELQDLYGIEDMTAKQFL